MISSMSKTRTKKHTEAFMFALPEARDSLGAVGSSHQWPVTPAQDPSNWDLRGGSGGITSDWTFENAGSTMLSSYLTAYQ